MKEKCASLSSPLPPEMPFPAATRMGNTLGLGFWISLVKLDEIALLEGYIFLFCVFLGGSFLKWKKG